MCVHTRHCCEIHGCKYGDKDCPVEMGIAKQEYDCEECYYAKQEENNRREQRDKLRDHWADESDFW